MVEDRTDMVEIDEVSSSHTTGYQETILVEEKDMFKNLDLSKLSLSKKIRNKGYRLNKRYQEGADGTQSKYRDPEQEMSGVNGYGLFDIVEPPYNLETLASLFEENSTHQACITARTMNTVGLGFSWDDTAKSRKIIEKATVKGNEDSLRRARERLQNEEDRLYELFNNFNVNDSITETMIKIWTDVLATGNGYMEIGRNRNGKIGYIGHIPSPYIRVRRQRDGYIQRSGVNFVYFRNFQDPHKTPDPINSDPNPNELIHFKMYSPTNTYYGVPSAVSALSAIIGDKFAKEYNIDYFENKSIPRYAIILKGGNLSPQSKKEVINYFRNEVKGNNHGTLFIPLPATLGNNVDIKFEALENTTQEASFDKYRKSNRDEITIAHRVPGTKIGIYDNANLAVSRDADKTFKVQVIGPDQEIFGNKMNRVVKEFSELKKFKFNEIDLIDEDLHSRIWDRYLRTSVVTPNEVRKQIGLTALTGGDEVLPYPTVVQQDKNDSDKEMAEKNLKAGVERTQPGSNGKPNSGGGQAGNNNALAGSPPKGSQDAAGKQGSPVDATTGRAERGQVQDQGGK